MLDDCGFCYHGNHRWDCWKCVVVGVSHILHDPLLQLIQSHTSHIIICCRTMSSWTGYTGMRRIRYVCVCVYHVIPLCIMWFLCNPLLLCTMWDLILLYFSKNANTLVTIQIFQIVVNSRLILMHSKTANASIPIRNFLLVRYVMHMIWIVFFVQETWKILYGFVAIIS